MVKRTGKLKQSMGGKAFRAKLENRHSLSMKKVFANGDNNTHPRMSTQGWQKSAGVASGGSKA